MRFTSYLQHCHRTLGEIQNSFPVQLKLIFCIAFGTASCGSYYSNLLVYWFIVKPLVNSVLWSMDRLIDHPLLFISFASGKFSNFLIWFHKIFYRWFIKNISTINRNTVIFYFYFLKKISCVSCSVSIILKWHTIIVFVIFYLHFWKKVSCISLSVCIILKWHLI